MTNSPPLKVFTQPIIAVAQEEQNRDRILRPFRDD